MKQKRLVIVSIACGVVCALCVFAFMGMVQGEAAAARAEALARYGGEQIDVCVATRDIAAGERVDASAVEEKLWVADLLPEEAIRDSADIVGRTTAASILKGEVVSEQRFQYDREELAVPDGKTAVSVPAKAVQAVGGAVRPGMQVAVYAAGDSGATVIAQGITVLATSGDEGSSAVGDASWITVAVDPEQVQELVTASTRYDLYFVLPGAAPQDAAKGKRAATNQKAGDGQGRAADRSAAQGDQGSATPQTVDNGQEAASGQDMEGVQEGVAVQNTDADQQAANEAGGWQ